MGADWNLEQTWITAYGLPKYVGVDMTNVYPNAPALGTYTSDWRWIVRLMEFDPSLPRPSPYYRPIFYYKRARWLISRLQNLGLNETHRILVVGSAFGALVHCFRHAGDYDNSLVNLPLTWGIDGSSYVSANFVNYSADVNGEDGTHTVFRKFENKQAVKSALTNLTGDWHFKVIITEQVLESLELVELATLANDCEAALDSLDYRRIIHLVDPTVAMSGTYSRTLDEWKLLRATHTYVDANNGDYRLGGV